MGNSGIGNKIIFGVAALVAIAFVVNKSNIIPEFMLEYVSAYDRIEPARVIFEDGFDLASIHQKMDDPVYSGALNNWLSFTIFYGAIATSDDGTTIWSDDYHTIEIAQAASLAICDARRSETSAPCEIAARVVPADGVPIITSDLSGPALFDYEIFKTVGRHRAFAIADNGAYSFIWDDITEASAKSEAIKDCNYYSAEFAPIPGVQAACYLYDVNGMKVGK